MSSSACPRISPLPDLLKLFKPLTSPEKFKDLCEMLRDRESNIKYEWENLEKECHSMRDRVGMLERLSKLYEMKFENKKRECEDLSLKFSRLSKDEKMWSDRAKQSEDYRTKVREQLSVVTTEKNREISELNKNLGMLNNQILERDQKIETLEMDFKNCEEKMAQIEIELQKLKEREYEFDQTMVEMEKLRNKNNDAGNIIGELRSRIICVETENNRKDNTIREMELKLSVLEDLKRRKLDAEEVAQVKTKKLKSLAPTITRLQEGLEKIFKVDIQDVIQNVINIINSEGTSDASENANLAYDRMHACSGSLNRGGPMLLQYSPMEEGNRNEINAEIQYSPTMEEGNRNEINAENDGIDQEKEIEMSEGPDATPSSNGEKENLPYFRMHACNGSQKTVLTGSPKLPQNSQMQEGTENEIRAENIAIEQEMETEDSDCIEIDKTTFIGLESRENFRENENMISEKFPLTSFIMKMKRIDRKWVLEDDMLTDFEEDEELCMNAVLVLYRRQISSSKSTLCDSDTKSVRDLGEYLMNQTSGYLPGKPLTEVKKNRPDDVVQCRRLATVYVDKLFQFYLNGEDPFFKLIKDCKVR